MEVLQHPVRPDQSLIVGESEMAVSDNAHALPAGNRQPVYIPPPAPPRPRLHRLARVLAARIFLALAGLATAAAAWAAPSVEG